MYGTLWSSSSTPGCRPERHRPAARDVCRPPGVELRTSHSRRSLSSPIHGSTPMYPSHEGNCEVIGPVRLPTVHVVLADEHLGPAREEIGQEIGVAGSLPG